MAFIDKHIEPLFFLFFLSLFEPLKLGIYQKFKAPAHLPLYILFSPACIFHFAVVPLCFPAFIFYWSRVNLFTLNCLRYPLRAMVKIYPPIPGSDPDTGKIVPSPLRRTLDRHRAPRFRRPSHRKRPGILSTSSMSATHYILRVRLSWGNRDRVNRDSVFGPSTQFRRDQSSGRFSENGVSNQLTQIKLGR